MTRLQAQGNGTVSRAGIRAMGKGKGLAEASSMPSGRPAKGSREWCDEIHTKADELEKLLASQKLRVRGGHGKKMPELRLDSSPASPAKSVVVDDAGGEMGSAIDRFDSGGTSSANSGVRGEFYGRYKERRDAKLAGEWRSERSAREAELKAMQDRLDLCWAEMKAAEFSGPVEKRDSSPALARRRVETSRALRDDRDPGSEEQDIVQISADDYKGERDQKRNRLAGGTSFEMGSSDAVISKRKSYDNSNDETSKSAISKKAVSSTRNTASPAPAKPTALPAKPSSRPSSVAATRRQPPEQSVKSTASKPPEPRKQIAKPMIGIGKAAQPTQSGKSAQKGGSYERAPQAKAAKSRRSPVKKSSVSPVDLSDSTPRNPDIELAKSSREVPSLSGAQEAVGEGGGEEPSSENCTLEQPASATPLDDTGDGDSRGATREVEDPSSSDKEEQQPEVPSAQLAPRSTGPLLHSNTLNLDIIDGSSMSSRREEGEPKPFSSPAVAELNLGRSISSSSQIVCESDDITASVDPLVLTTTTASPQVHPLNWATETVSAPLGRWASADKVTFAANAPRQARKKDVASGLRWLMRFGRRSKGSEAAAEAATPSGEQGNQSFTESVQRSRTEFAQHHSFHGCFPANESFDSRGRTSQASTPRSQNTKLREGNTPISSPKVSRLLFSLPSFRKRGSESKT